MKNLFEKKHQIFISSTYSDLIKERSEVIKVILDIYQISIGMEMFSADNADQWDTIKRTTESSDYYLLIVGHRYGSLTKENISYTEKEFDYAKIINVPILSFIRERNIPTLPTQRESDPKNEKKLNHFLEKVQKTSMCDYWSNETELAKKVAVALPEIIFKTPRTGWIRSDQVNSLASSGEITQLNQENRELRREIEILKSLQTNSSPEVDVLINGSKKIFLQTQPAYNPIKKVFYMDLLPSQKKFVTETDFIIYNEEVDKRKDEVDQYNQELNKYHNIQNNCINVDLEIINTGNIKLNDLFIDINFPEEVIVLEEANKNDYKYPATPLNNPNPKRKAERLGEEYNNRGSRNFLAGMDNYSGSRRSISNLMFNQNKKFYIDSEKNLLTIKLDKLSHTRQYRIKQEILLSAHKKGNYSARIKIISDELKEPIEQEISIIVQ